MGVGKEKGGKNVYDLSPCLRFSLAKQRIKLDLQSAFLSYHDTAPPMKWETLFAFTPKAFEKVGEDLLKIARAGEIQPEMRYHYSVSFIVR